MTSQNTKNRTDVMEPIVFAEKWIIFTPKSKRKPDWGKIVAKTKLLMKLLGISRNGIESWGPLWKKHHSLIPILLKRENDINEIRNIINDQTLDEWEKIKEIKIIVGDLPEYYKQ